MTVYSEGNIIKYLSCAALDIRGRPLSLLFDVLLFLFSLFSSRITVYCEQFILFAMEHDDNPSLSNATATFFLRGVS